MSVVESKCDNGNTLVWLSQQPIHDCEHIPILAGGDVKLLKTIETISRESIIDDLSNLNKTGFLKKHNWPDNSSSGYVYDKLKEIHNR
jgi:hypothetical protein